MAKPFFGEWPNQGFFNTIRALLPVTTQSPGEVVGQTAAGDIYPIA